MCNTRKTAGCICIYVCTHVHIDVTMAVKEEVRNLRAVEIQEELEEKMSRNDINTVYVRKFSSKYQKKALFFSINQDNSWLHQVYS